jgi:hypothetical protein
MAERRMFAKTIVDSDAFLDMPQSTQLLYFHLSMRADDDGFINRPKSIMREVGCKDDDLKILAVKNMGRNNLFQLLRDKAILMPNNQPYQKYIDCGYFRTIESRYTKPYRTTHINIKTVVYQKGIDYIRKIAIDG